MNRTRVISYARLYGLKNWPWRMYKAEVAGSQEWCEHNGYKLDEARPEQGEYSGTQKDIAQPRLQRQLTRCELPLGSIVLIDTFGAFSQDVLKQAIVLVMQLNDGGLLIVTINDMKGWDRDRRSDIGAFVISVTLLYSDTQQMHLASRRASYARRASAYKKEA